MTGSWNVSNGRSPTLVVLDIKMAAYDGLDLLQEIRQ